MFAKSVRVGLVACSILVAFGGSVPTARSQGETIKIVSSLPRTGTTKAQTDSIVNAFQMALDEVNFQVAGFNIVYQDLDDATPAKGAWDAGQEATNANLALADPDVMVYLGPFNSGAARVSIPILNHASLVMISPVNTYPGLTKLDRGEANEPGVYAPTGVRNYTRVVPADDLQGAVGARWAKQLGVQRAYVLDDTKLYGHMLAGQFADAARRLGLQVVAEPEGINPKAPDYLALAAKIRDSGADLVYHGGITQNNAGQLFKDLRATLGPDVKLMAPDGIYEQAFITAAGAAAEGVYVTFNGVAPANLSGKGADWYASYKARFNAEPEVYASYGYEAMKVALDAIGRAGTKDRARIRDAVFATKDYNGVLGTWSFDQNGDTTLTTMSGHQVKNGSFDERNAVILTVDELIRPVLSPSPAAGQAVPAQA